MIFYAIVIGLPLLHLAWWGALRRATRGLPLRPSRRRLLRLVSHLLAVVLLLGYFWTIGARLAGRDYTPPLVLLVATYIWYLVILPWALPLTAVAAALGRRAGVRPAAVPEGEEPASAEGVADAAGETANGPGPGVESLSRRELLAAGLAGAAPLAVLSSVGVALPRLQSLRVRPFEVPLAGLPAALDGLTIAHLSDTHVGKLVDERMIARIVAETNRLRPDLCLFTGDLIDFSLADLPAGLDLLRGVEPRYGRFLCEGNHDLFESRSDFEERTRAAGVGLLLDEAASLRIRGCDVQVLGTRWAGRVRGRQPDVRPDHLGATLALRDPDAFSILLAHHPHEFDRAAQAGVPLTLAGHTHGGQLMLTDDLGAGPLLFKYWSGLYRAAGPSGAALVVSNGAGNWFPLRVNAPAEIVHVTLRAAPASA